MEWQQFRLSLFQLCLLWTTQWSWKSYERDAGIFYTCLQEFGLTTWGLMLSSTKMKTRTVYWSKEFSNNELKYAVNTSQACQ
jgi:hypothetical protein